MYNFLGFLTMHIFINVEIEIKLSLALSHQMTPDIYEVVLFNNKKILPLHLCNALVIQGDSMSTHSYIM